MKRPYTWGMRTPIRLLVFPIATALILAALPLAAQDIQNTPPAGTILVEQKSDIAAVGKWTLLMPTHESFDRTDAVLAVPNMIPGKYTFLIAPPKGTSVHIDLLLGDDIIATADSPQISFELADKMTLKILVKHTLTISGKVGVNSAPSGIPFTLRGPNELVEIGITPAEFSPYPIGNYSVTYRPEGCPQPPTQAGLLLSENRIDFNVDIVCATLRVNTTQSAGKNVSTFMGGTEVIFFDVPADSWFGPYIATVTRRGVMAGYTDAQGQSTGRFGPSDPVTIAQLAKIAHTAVKLSENDVTTAPKNPLARGQWFTRYIASAEDRGWQVFADGTVDPNRPATRGEVVTTLLQIFDIPVKWPKGNMFSDVLRSTPYAGSVETAANEKIVSGSSGPDGKPTGLFHPVDQITRAEIAKILITVYEKYQADSSSSL